MKTCPHRGHELDEKGNCPYHGFPCNYAKLSRRPPAETLPFDAQLLLDLQNDRGEKFFSYHMIVNAPVLLWMQNTMDVHHLRHVHLGGFANVFGNNPKPKEVRISADLELSSWKIAVQPDVVRSFERVVQQWLPPYFTHVSIYPNRSLTSFLSVFYSEETMEPIDDGQSCRVTTRFYTSRRMKVRGSLVSAAREANQRVLEEDRAICESWAKSYKTTGWWLPGEERIRAYLMRADREKDGQFDS